MLCRNSRKGSGVRDGAVERADGEHEAADKDGYNPEITTRPR